MWFFERRYGYFLATNCTQCTHIDSWAAIEIVRLSQQIACEPTYFLFFLGVMFCSFCFFVFFDVKRPYHYYCTKTLYTTTKPPLHLYNPSTLKTYKREVVLRICKLICALRKCASLALHCTHCIAINPRLPFQLTAQAISQNCFYKIIL